MAGVFARAGTPLYLVGGAVRNALMGLPVSDVDVCGPALPREVESLCAGTEIHARLRAAHFGTVELHLRDENGGRHMAEYTTFRQDSYRCGHRPDRVRFTKELSQDALRRDFSVNALYCPLTASGAGEIIDPTGGRAHLSQGVLHTVTADPDQVLREDGLRILRAARFQAQLGLAPTAALLASAKRHASLLADIAPERLRDELVKIMLADSRYPSLRRAAPPVRSGLLTVRRMGAWAFLFPRLAFEETAARSLDGLWLPPNAPVLPGRLALLFWRESEEAVSHMLSHYRFSRAEARQTLALHRGMRCVIKGGLSLWEAAQAGQMEMAFAQVAWEALAAREPSEAAREEAATRAREAGALRQRLSGGVPLSLRELAVDGNDLRPLLERGGCPARQTGALLNGLWRETVEGRLENQREALLKAAEAWVTAQGKMETCRKAGKGVYTR